MSKDGLSWRLVNRYILIEQAQRKHLFEDIGCEVRCMSVEARLWAR